jgi:hypothetical protein
MNKIQLRPPPLSPEIKQAYASPPCLTRQVESSFGFWLWDEELVFLNELLTLKRKVAKALVENADRHVADVALEMELLQASFYDFFREEIEARGGQAIVGSLGKKPFKEVHAKCDLTQAIAIASRGQRELVEAIQKAFLKMPDHQLRLALAAVQKLQSQEHRAFKDLT